MQERESILARRLSVTVHVSPLRRKLRRLSEQYPSADAACLEDWLVDVANARGARIVGRSHADDWSFAPPPFDALSNEELVVGICQPQSLDRPQMLRLAAQLISRGAVGNEMLQRLAKQERAELVLAELARQALRADPQHELWRALATSFAHQTAPRSPILHWTRLAQPVMDGGRCNASEWRLVA